MVAAALLAPPLPAPRPNDSDPAPQIAGETFELPAPETQEIPLANASPAPDSTAVPSASEEGEAPIRSGPASPSRPVQGRPSVDASGPHGRPARASHATRPSGGRAAPDQGDGAQGATATPALYGAVGERSAADLATAFTRGFPQAASADPIWRSAALGSAGDAEVVLTLDETGHIEGAQVLGAPSPALSSAIRRTLSLIKGRPFVAKAKTTKLHLSATISTDSIHDGLHGDVFAIGGSFAGGEGSAFFALAIGRRIDVRVRSK